MPLKNGLKDFVIFKNTALHLKYAIWLVKIMMQYMQRQSLYKVHLNMIRNEELSGPLCDIPRFQYGVGSDSPRQH